MPWVRKPTESRKPYWTLLVITLSALGVGILIGYTKWGATASIVTLVEKELTETQAHIKALEKRMTVMESLVMGDGSEGGLLENGGGPVKKFDGKATRNHFKGEEKKVWHS